ncbi:MAG: HAD hydrolase-like protein [Candidatus Saccharibacteria bacterium]
MKQTSSNTPRGVELIIWDLDGTLLNSLIISIDVWQTVLPRHGFSAPTKHEVARNYHGTLLETAQSLAPLATPKQTTAILNDFMIVDNAYIQDANYHLFPDAVSLAERAHATGAKQILVTNRAHGIDRLNASPRNLIANSRLRDLFDVIICSDEVVERKPSRHVLSGIEHDPSKTLIVGDQFVDAQFAANLGCQAVLVNRNGFPIAHLDKLDAGWEAYVQLVQSLDEVDL